MSSDGKGSRKLRRPKCPKCHDAGYTVRMVSRAKGKLVGPAAAVRCPHCRAGKEWGGRIGE